jgi:hypothetical protein
MNPIFNKLKNVLAGGTGQLIEKAGVLIDNLTMSKEEKEQFKENLIKLQNEHEIAILNAAQAETDSYLKDVADSRISNVHIQESDKASWLAKNVGYILDLSVAILFYAMLFLIFFITIPQDNKEIFYTAFGVLGAKYGSSFDFHRGSSVGSKQNGDALRKMVTK